MKTLVMMMVAGGGVVVFSGCAETRDPKTLDALQRTSDVLEAVIPILREK